jgi:hypothetical protein
MRTTCLKCNNALTIRDVIQNTCSKCTPPVRSGNRMGKLFSSTSEIKTRFDALISEELKKRAFEPAA